MREIMGCLTIIGERLNRLHIKGKRLNRLHINGSLLCDVSVGGRLYLRVKPEDSIRWISPDYEITYDVESNTDWVVE